MALRRISPDSGKSQSGDYEKLPDGEYEGRLVYVADLGLQERKFKDEVKPPCQQISLGIEVLGHPVRIDGDEQPRVLWTKPFNIFHEMTGKGNELKMFSVFNTTAREGEVADWEGVLGSPCNVVVGTRNVGDKSYDEIRALTPIPERYASSVPEGQLIPCVGDAEDPSNQCTMNLFGLVKFIHDRRLPESGGRF